MGGTKKSPKKAPAGRVPRMTMPKPREDDDPTTDPAYLAIAAAVSEDRLEMERQFWFDQWCSQWSAATVRFFKVEEETPADPTAMAKANMVCVELLEKWRGWRNGEKLKPLPAGPKRDLEEWKHRAVIAYLKTGVYKGPDGRRVLPKPEPLWTRERLTRLVEASGWVESREGDDKDPAELVRLALRETRTRSVQGSKKAAPVTLGYHGSYCVPRRFVPSVLDRWEKLKPLAFGSRDLRTIEAVNERFQIITEILDEFSEPDVVAGALATASCGHDDCAEGGRKEIKKFIHAFRNKFEKVLREIETVVGSETDD